MSTLDWLDPLPGDGVYSLRDAQSTLLQVLLPEFHLARDGKGVTLKVRFGADDLAIRRREAKGRVMARMPGYRPDRIEEVQDRIDDVLFRGGKPYLHADPSLPFRYASGGTLPILEIGSDQYYCLFCRDVFPVGWNIANGSCDSLAELLNPKRAIERELREELIVLSLHSDPPLDHVFHWPGEAPAGEAVFDDARRLASRFLADGLDMRHFRRVPLEVIWDPPGPDTLVVEFDGKRTIQQGFFLNLNARDFGIEADRIARIRPAPGFRLLDGELNDNRLLNRPIGLFEVGRTQQAVHDGATSFLPDLLFWSLALDLDGPLAPCAKLEDFVESKFLRYLRENQLRSEEEIARRQALPLAERFDLCPVTRSLIRRHACAKILHVFLAHSHADRSFAERLERDLARRQVEVWRAERELRPADRIDRAIEQALDASSHVLLLASRRSVASDFVGDEVLYASNKRRPGMVLKLEDCEVPMRAAGWPQIDFREEHRYGAALDELCRALFRRSGSR